MKLTKFLKDYATITQGIFSIAVYALLGYGIGYLIDKNSFWPILLLVIGMILGLITFIVFLLRLLKENKTSKEISNDGEDSKN